MRGINKKFITDCIEKHPEVKEYNKLYGLTVNVVKHALSEDYSYTPEDKEYKTISDKNAKLNVQIEPCIIDNIDDFNEIIKKNFRTELSKVYGFFDESKLQDLKLRLYSNSIQFTFSYERKETKSEYASRMIKDLQLKALFNISLILKSEHNEAEIRAIREKDEKERRELQTQITELENRKKLLESKISS